MRLEGRVALVTGAARRLGRAIAEGLAAAGCDIALHYGRSLEQARVTATALERMGARVETFEADLTDPAAPTRLVDAVGAAFGRLDVLVNSAAGFERRNVEETGAAEWDAVLALNLRAPFLVLRQAASLLAGTPREGEAAAVVNVADLSGVFPWRGYLAHGVSKAGLLQLTRGAALELAPAVRVNAVVPGAVLPPPGVEPDDRDWLDVGRRMPLGRCGDPGQVADAVVFLCRNDFVTGEVLFVDGGEHLYGSTKR